MVDSKMVVSQVQEMQIILHDIGVDGMELNESLHIVAMLCKDFKNAQRQDNGGSDCSAHIKEDNGATEKKSLMRIIEAKANMIEKS